MKKQPVYPTEFQTYKDAVEKAYGDFVSMDLNAPLIREPLLSKRYCRLLPRLASSQIQQSSVAAEDELFKVLGQTFAEMIIHPELHQKLYASSSEEDLSRISANLFTSLEQGISEQIQSVPIRIIETSFFQEYRKLLMPLKFEPIPGYLIDEIKQAFKEMATQILQSPDYYDQVHPSDLFVLHIQIAAEQYYQGKGIQLLSEYPVIPEGKGIPFSVWGVILAIKWDEVIQEYIRTIEESQYRREPFILQVLSQKAISLKDFLALETEKALVLQAEAEQAYLKSFEELKSGKDREEKYSKLIPWMRGEENLQALWGVLDETRCIEREEFHYFLGGHFYLINKSSKDSRTIITHKIKWKSTPDNLIRMLESLVNNNIISVLPFGKRTDTEIAGRIYNLILAHFSCYDGNDFKLDAIRKAAQRKRSPKAKIDKAFNGSVLKKIRSMQ